VEAALFTIAVFGPVFGFGFYVYRLLCRILSRETEHVRLFDMEQTRIFEHQADIQKRMLSAQMKKAKEDAFAWEIAPDKQCQGCGAFGKGHRCFYCKRTYEISARQISQRTTEIFQFGKGIPVYSFESARNPYWTENGMPKWFG